MIPSSNGFLNRDFIVKEQPSRTYKMNFESEIEHPHIRGNTDGKEAMNQLIYKILNTERYQYIIYSWNFGVEIADLFGEPISYVIPEIKRRITEALTFDKRITSVDSFSFEIKKRTVYANFVAHTIFGDIPFEKGVDF